MDVSFLKATIHYVAFRNFFFPGTNQKPPYTQHIIWLVAANRAFRLVVRSSFVFCKQQLLLAEINYVIYFSQSQLLFPKTNEDRTTGQKSMVVANSCTESCIVSCVYKDLSTRRNFTCNSQHPLAQTNQISCSVYRGFFFKFKFTFYYHPRDNKKLYDCFAPTVASNKRAMITICTTLFVYFVPTQTQRIFFEIL